MKTKKGIILHQVGDEYILMNDGSSNVDFSNIINLNPSAAYLWQELEKRGEADTETVARLLQEQYEVSEEQARRDAEDFVQKLIEAEVIE